MSEQKTAFAGFKIKGLRIDSNYSPTETAKALDITTSYLSLIENGKKQPSKKVLNKAAEYFNVPIKAFEEDPSLLRDLQTITNEAELSEIIQAFEIILREKS